MPEQGRGSLKRYDYACLETTFQLRTRALLVGKCQLPRTIPADYIGAHAFDEDEVEAILRNPKCKKAARSRG